MKEMLQNGGVVSVKTGLNCSSSEYSYRYCNNVTVLQDTAQSHVVINLFPCFGSFVHTAVRGVYTESSATDSSLSWKHEVHLLLVSVLR